RRSGRGGGRFVAPCRRAESRAARSLASARRPPHGHRRHGGRGCRLRPAHQGRHARSALTATGGGIVRERYTARRNTAARAPVRASDRRGGDPHVRRGGRTARPLSGRGEPARAVPRARAGLHGARHNYAVALFRQGKHAAALPEVERLLAIEPRNPNYRSLHAAVLAGVGEYARATNIYRQVIEEYPRQAKIWRSEEHTSEL